MSICDSGVSYFLSVMIHMNSSVEVFSNFDEAILHNCPILLNFVQVVGDTLLVLNFSNIFMQIYDKSCSFTL